MRAKTRLIILGALTSVLSFVLPTAVTSASAAPLDLPAHVAFDGGGPPAVVPTAGAISAPSTPASVTVRNGDSLSSIAEVLGLSWMQLAGFNKVPDPNLILPGLVLRIPPAGYQPPPTSLPPPPAARIVTAAASSPAPAPHASYGGVYSYSMLESLWISVGGPAWAAPHAAEIAQCESGGEPWKYNDGGSGAAGLWQILGQVVPGNILDPTVNAENAVSKFRASGDTFAQWVCR